MVRGHTTQVEFAKEMGIPVNTLGRYERGINNPDVGFLLSLNKKFGISLDWLILGFGDQYVGQANNEESLLPACRQCGELMSRLNTVNDRLYQATERERELLKENSELRAELVVIKSKQQSKNTTGYVQTA